MGVARAEVNLMGRLMRASIERVGLSGARELWA